MDLRLVGGITLGVGALSVGAGAIYRHSVGANADGLPQRQSDVTAREGDVASAQGALQAALPHDPEHPTDAQALDLARQRFGATTFGVAHTDDGDSATLRATAFSDRAERTADAALADAKAIANGKASAAVQVGDRYVGVVLDSKLEEQGHSRDVSYNETEYNYHYGLNPATSAYEYHLGPEVVTKTRREDYLSAFDQLDPANFGVAASADGEGKPLKDNGTAEQQAVSQAEDGLRQAHAALDSSAHAQDAAAHAGLPLFIGGGAVAGAGALALLAGLRRA